MPPTAAKANAASDARRSVRFSEMSSLAVIQPASRFELRQRWYTEAERDGFRQKLVEDVRKMSTRLTSTPMVMVDEAELYECIGMEALLSRDILTRTRDYKRNHVRSVLAAQAHQRRRNARDDEFIALLSESSSTWARDRAANIAATYWTSLKTH